jgi:hypothetical protein
VGSVDPLRGIGITDPGLPDDYQLVMNVNIGQIAIPVDIPGGLTAGQITGNGTTFVTITATLEEINTTFSDPYGLMYATGALSNATLQMNLSLAVTPGEIIDTLAVPITVYADAYECWQQLTFTPAELAAGIGLGQLDDFDNDGTYNLIEFATGLDARNPSARNPISLSIHKEGGQSYVEIGYNRKEPPAGLVFSLEIYNTETEIWEPAGSSAVLVDGPTFINPRFQSVVYRLTDPVAGPATLVRFKVVML